MEYGNQDIYSSDCQRELADCAKFIDTYKFIFQCAFKSEDIACFGNFGKTWVEHEAKRRKCS